MVNEWNVLDEEIISGCSLAGFKQKLDGCIVWNVHNTVLGVEALLIHIVPVGYAT